MTHFAAPRRAPAIKPLALAIFLSLSAAAHADEATLPEVTITGARFASDPALMPIGATVITADDIRRAGASDVNQAIRKVGGVYGRQSLDGSPDFALDLGGFGAASSQNLVVMLDGVRMSENDLGGPILSTIPIETIERIEIVRGGSSVLYGDGATGGVIQIVTKRGAAQAGTRGSVRAELGQFGLRDGRASLSGSWDAFTIDAALGALRTDNYRANGAFEQNTFSGGAAWRYGAGRVGVRIDVARQQAGMPGSLTEEQFQADPRMASTPQDFGSVDSDRVTFSAEHRVGTFDLAADLSHRRKQVEATYYFRGIPGTQRYDSKQTQFSPRLRQLAQFDGLLNEVVAGIDLGRWSRVTASGFGDIEESQASRALYVRDELKWNAMNARLALGARHEQFDKDATGAPGSKQSQNAWDVQGSVDAAAKVNLFAKAGHSFRVPTADENGYRAGVEMLRIQRSRDLELGARLGDQERGATVRLFRHALTDEIFYDPTIGGFGANTNLDPTERRGLEIDAHAALATSLRLSAHLQHVQARFTAGANDGNEMVLVPKNVLAVRLSWAPGQGHSVDAGMQWVDRQRDGGDFSNTCGTGIASYTTFDARYARRIGAWEFAIAGLNLGDRQYYSNAFGCGYGIYPSDGRQLKASVRYDF